MGCIHNRFNKSVIIIIVTFASSDKRINIPEESSNIMNEPDSRTPREILSKFYSDNNLPSDGGQSSGCVEIKLSRNFRLYFPNFNARRKAVLKHDIHHLLTGYDTTVSGESEISAWEIASGCKNYWAAFLLDTSGFMLGFLVNYFGILKAFARGRRTKNLYYDMFSNEQALDMQVCELRNQLLLDKYTKNTKPTFTDFIQFSLLTAFGILFSILSWVLIPYIIVYTIYIMLNVKS